MMDSPGFAEWAVFRVISHDEAITIINIRFYSWFVYFLHNSPLFFIDFGMAFLFFFHAK